MSWINVSLSDSTSSFVPFRWTPMEQSLIRCSPMSRTRELIAGFPNLIASQKEVLNSLITVADNRLGSQLLPSSSSIPPDTELYQNETGSSHGALTINRGLESSHIDFILTSCLHLKLPNESLMNIVTLQGFVKPSNDAPHFVFELIQTSPSSFILILDLTHRKDLILFPEYLNSYYLSSLLEACRKRLYEQVPEAKPFISSSLRVRSGLSPAGIMALIECDGGAPKRIQEIISGCISPMAEELFGTWIDWSSNGANVSEEERGVLEKRDYLIKNNVVEIDLAPKLPMIFGQQVGGRVIKVIRNVYGV